MPYEHRQVYIGHLFNFDSKDKYEHLKKNNCFINNNNDRIVILSNPEYEWCVDHHKYFTKYAWVSNNDKVEIFKTTSNHVTWLITVSNYKQDNSIFKDLSPLLLSQINFSDL